ncbi:hypothetical protein [Nocardia sp. NBC_01327]|uniref:hypothetical protein n=1 Tax=Nocardia sp. NBC_01327 TaxID=2903593 RepID=UPI002E15F80C|nr:hypothetical protein OG326_24240 [Nocardia sp. NBC_01327]
MTPEAIRAKAIERLAKALHWQNEYACLPDDPSADHWELADEDTRTGCRVAVTFYVDALGDMFPIETQWRVDHDEPDEWGVSVFNANSREDARHFASMSAGTVQVRYLSDWTEATG